MDYHQNSISDNIGLFDDLNIGGGDVQQISPYFPPSTSEDFGNGLSTNAIMGRDERHKVSDISAYPYSAIVAFFDAEEEAQCLGALIGEDTILTAVHCLITDEGGW